MPWSVFVLDRQDIIYDCDYSVPEKQDGAYTMTSRMLLLFLISKTLMITWVTSMLIPISMKVLFHMSILIIRTVLMICSEIKGWKAKSISHIFCFCDFSSHTASKILVSTPHNYQGIMWGRDKNFLVLMLYELRNCKNKKYARDVFAAQNSSTKHYKNKS